MFLDSVLGWDDTVFIISFALLPLLPVALMGVWSYIPEPYETVFDVSTYVLMCWLVVKTVLGFDEYVSGKEVEKQALEQK